MRSMTDGSIAVLNYCLLRGERRFAFGMLDSKSSIFLKGELKSFARGPELINYLRAQIHLLIENED